MAEVKSLMAVGTPEFGGTPYGNTQNRHFIMKTNANGSLVGGNSGAAIGATDTVVLGILRSGMRLDDALAIIPDAFTATITGDLGFRYVDGVDDTQAQADKENREYVPQDADYFFADLNAATVGRTRANNTAVKPVTLPKDAYLVWTNQVAAHASVGEAHFIIYGEDRGPL